MSIQVKIINTSDSYGIETARLDRSERCKCCGHLEPARRIDAETILPRDEHERIIKLGDSLILTALMDSGLPRAHY